jgi:Papain family cysteine protease
MREYETIVDSDGHMSLTILVLLYSTYSRNGCIGGMPENAYNWAIGRGGIEEEDNILRSLSVWCKLIAAAAVKVKRFYHLTEPDREKQMINHVLAGGTLSVIVDSTLWSNYKGGIFSGCTSKITLNHAVNIVGVNVPGGYWIVRNSWGTWWGAQGYMYVALVRDKGI